MRPADAYRVLLGRTRTLWGHRETIAERFEKDREKLLPLPPTLHEACRKRTTRASSQSLVRYETNDYSVPTEHGHQQVLVKAFVWRSGTPMADGKGGGLSHRVGLTATNELLHKTLEPPSIRTPERPITTKLESVAWQRKCR